MPEDKNFFVEFFFGKNRFDLFGFNVSLNTMFLLILRRVVLRAEVTSILVFSNWSGICNVNCQASACNN